MANGMHNEFYFSILASIPDTSFLFLFFDIKNTGDH